MDESLYVSGLDQKKNYYYILLDSNYLLGSEKIPEGEKKDAEIFLEHNEALTRYEEKKLAIYTSMGFKSTKKEYIYEYNKYDIIESSSINGNKMEIYKTKLGYIYNSRRKLIRSLELLVVAR